MKKTKLADDYLALKALQAELSEKEERLKRALLQLGGDEFEGRTGRVTISTAAGRTTWNSDLLEQHVPAATLALCKKTGNQSLRFNVSARVVKAKIAA